MSVDVRIYSIYGKDKPQDNVEIKGLSTKEKEMVISTIEMTEEFKGLLETDTAKGTEFARFPFKVGDTIQESQIIEYAGIIRSYAGASKLQNDELSIIYRTK